MLVLIVLLVMNQNEKHVEHYRTVRKHTQGTHTQSLHESLITQLFKGGKCNFNNNLVLTLKENKEINLFIKDFVHCLVSFSV